MRIKLQRLSLGVSLLLSACAASPTATPATPTASPTASPTAAAVAPTAPALATTLQLWLPPQFAPDEAVSGGNTLAAQLAQFEALNPELHVQVRLKAADGPAGLLESLLTAYNVAPEALPDMVALSQADLAQAALAGVILPLDDLVAPETLADYYPFAQALSQVDGKTAGLPFAADARLLVYNTDVYTTAPLRWAEVVTGTLIFPGAEPAALTLLTEYLASGGVLTDSAGQPQLEPDRLRAALTTLQNLQFANVLPVSTLTYADPAATWQVFRERRATLALTSAQWYLLERSRVIASAAILPPTQNGRPFTLASGWSWTIINTGKDPARAASLLNWLSEPARLAEWSQAARVLPTRASALAEWGDTPVAALAAEVLPRAQLQPARPLLDVVGPPIQKALQDVLNQRATPADAAAAASQALRIP